MLLNQRLYAFHAVYSANKEDVERECYNIFARVTTINKHVSVYGLTTHVSWVTITTNSYMVYKLFMKWNQHVKNWSWSNYIIIHKLNKTKYCNCEKKRTINLFYNQNLYMCNDVCYNFYKYLNLIQLLEF